MVILVFCLAHHPVTILFVLLVFWHGLLGGECKLRLPLRRGISMRETEELAR